MWLDSSSANGVDYDTNDTPDPIPWHPRVVQEVVFHLDANDSDSLTLSNEDVAEWIDKSGNGYNMIAQGHPKLVDYGYGTDLKVVRFESKQNSKSDRKAGGDSLYTEKNGTQVRVTSPCLRLLATHLMKEKNTKIIFLFPIGPGKDPGGLDLDTIN